MLKFGTVKAVDTAAIPYPLVQVESQSEAGRIVECHILASHKDLYPVYAAGDLVAFDEEGPGVAVVLGAIVTSYAGANLKGVARVGDTTTCAAGGGQITGGSSTLLLQRPSS
jgi:hypothetical protein